MSITFNAQEILQMAEEIERNGAAFYREAAGRNVSQYNRDLLVKLAEMEEGHAKLFAGMKADLSAEERKPVTFDPNDETGLYLKALADRQVFGMPGEPPPALTGKETFEDVLRLAIQAEKDSVVFYVGMRDMVPERLGRSRIDEIIKEEMGHFGSLSAMLADELA